MVTRLESNWGTSLRWKLDPGEFLRHPETLQVFGIAEQIIKIGDYTHLDPPLISVQNEETSDKFEFQASDVSGWIGLIEHEPEA